jgi:hypothetical protein
MTIHEMIVKGRLLLQRNNSNIHQYLQDEEWCDAINITISEFVRKHTYDPRDSNRDNYDIVKHSDGLQSLIRTSSFDNPKAYINFVDGYYANLKSLDNDVTGYLSIAPLKSGLEYRIVTLNGSDSFISVGATYNNEGEIFTCNFVASETPVLNASGTILRYDTDRYTTHSTTSLRAGVVYTINQGSVTFPVGYTLKVVANGNDYYLAGANQNRTIPLVLTVGDTFMIYEEYTTQWSGYSILEEMSYNSKFFKYISSKSDISYTCDGASTIVEDVPNRLVKVKDIENFRLRSRGSITKTPMCVLHNSNLVVFSNESLPYVDDNAKYTIDKIKVTYYKKPNQVSISANVDCDLDDIVHEEIVRKTVDTLLASKTSQYNVMKNETNINTQQ